MGVRSGYKQTEIGVIPNEWEAPSIESFANFTSGKGIKVSTLSEMSSDFPIPVFGGNGIAGYTSEALIMEPTVIVGRVGQKCGEVYVTEGPAWITDNALYPRNIHQPVNMHFLALALKAAGLNDLKNRNDLPLVTQSIVHALRVAWPPTSGEQDAIVKAMDDMDALQDGLEGLLAKKRDIKQATMQQLLTGQTRLPCFTGEWETKKLGEMLTICHGKSQRGIETEDGVYPILATGGQIGRTNRYLCDKPSVLIGRKGTIDQPQYMDTPFWTVDTLFYSIVKNGNNAKFLFYLFLRIDWKRYNEASGVPSLNARTIEGIEAKCPEPHEQEAIATVLTDMDAELAALEQRLTKTRDLKQAMMQELLTGKTRLVTSEAVHA